MASEKCKSTFESRYLAPDKKTDKRSYEKLFPKEMLDEKRSHVNELNNILKAMGV